MTLSYKLADGVLLLDDPPLYQIYNLQTQQTIVADFRHMPFLKSVAAGLQVDSPHPLLHPLIELGVISEGKPGVDSIILQALRDAESISQVTDLPDSLYETLLRQYAHEKYFSLEKFKRQSNPLNLIERARFIHQYLNRENLQIGCLGSVLDPALTHFGHHISTLEFDFTPAQLDPIDALVIADTLPPASLVTLLHQIPHAAPVGIPIFLPLHSDLAPIFLNEIEKHSIEIMQWHPLHLTYCHPYTGQLAIHADLLVIRNTDRSTLNSAAPNSAPQEFIPKRSPTSKGFIGVFHEIKNSRYAQPMYLELLLQAFCDLNTIDFATKSYLAQEWTYIASKSAKTNLRLHADRINNVVRIELTPYDEALERSLRDLLFTAFDLRLTDFFLQEMPDYWLLHNPKATKKS